MKIKLKSDTHCPIQFPVIYDYETETYEVSDDFIRDLLFYLSGAEQDNYTSLLIRLIFHADIQNKRKLANAYREEVLTIWAYQNLPDFWGYLYEEANKNNLNTCVSLHGNSKPA